ncbi:hypothetical protein [Streptomyces sp. NPDC002851]
MTRRNHEEGWRVELLATKRPHPTEDGLIAFPLWLVKDGEHVGDIELALSPHEAEQLHAGLCYQLGEHGQEAVTAPACRDVPGGPKS